MTDSLNIPGFEDLPVEVDTLAALVEGDLDDREADRVREALLRADPELARRVELMAHDRVALRTLPDAPPPAGLAEAITEQLERETLLGLASGEPTAGSIAVSRVPRVSPAHRRRRLRPAGVGLAAAAMLALGVGLALRFGTPAETMPPASEGTTIARSETQTRPAPAEAETPPVAVAADVPDPPAGGESPASLASGSAPAEPETFTGDWDRALALLGEGRLLVRVRTAAPERVASRLASLQTRTPRPGESWRLGPDVPGSLAAAVHARFAPESASGGPLVLAGSEEAPSPLVGSPAAAGTVLEGVYMADARFDRAAMASLLSALSLGDDQAAVFEELPEALHLPGVHTPEAVLWWSRPPSEWSERRHVPVVIERVER